MEKLKDKNLKGKESDLEICVSCYNVTNVRKDKPIQEREYYVEGAGQLCAKCYKLIYEPNQETRK